MIIDHQGCEFRSEPLYIEFGSNHFQPIEKLNQDMPNILPTTNMNDEIIDLDTFSNQEDNDVDSQKGNNCMNLYGKQMSLSIFK